MPIPTLTFLGTGASCGVPSYYCGCAACEEAMTNPKAARGCACLLVSVPAADPARPPHNTLIDASPDLRTQLSRERCGHIERVLFTHEHFDHIGGIPQLEYYSRLVSHAPLPFYANEPTRAAIQTQFAFMDDTFELHAATADDPLTFDSIRYTPLPAAHCPGAFGYLIESLADNNVVCRLAYFPDTGTLPQATFERLAAEPLDYLIIDATFNGANWMPASHHTIDGAVALAAKLKPRQTYLTHLSMHYDTPITLAQLETKLQDLPDVDVAYDGMRIELA
jgi:phosphoribosyl 1,2-cyclic phosphate phosphodiesterase